MYTQDFVLNGRGYGELGQLLEGSRFDPGMHRPYFDHETGHPCVNIDTGRKEYNEKTGRYERVHEQVRLRDLAAMDIHCPVANATTLRKDEWIQVDRTAKEVYRAQITAWSDMQRASSETLDGMSKMILEHETVSDPGYALEDMDGIAEGQSDRPLFQLEGIPLPIQHVNFWYSRRNLEVGRGNGRSLSMRTVEAATRRLAELTEQTTIGIRTGITYGVTADYGRAPTVYGYTNFTARNTYTSVTTPTGANPNATVSNVLAMRDLLYADNRKGPYMLYHSNDWDQYMDHDYSFINGTGWATAPNQTLRQRLRAIGDEQGGPGQILGVKRLDFWTPASAFQLLLVDMTSDTLRAIIGLPPTVIQYESKGGQQVNFKIMTIQVPQLFADYDGRCGICHGTTA